MYIIGGFINCPKPYTIWYSPLRFLYGENRGINLLISQLAWSNKALANWVLYNRSKAQQGQRRDSFLLGHVHLVLDGLSWTPSARPTCAWAQTSGFTPGRSNCSVWGDLFSAINNTILCPLSKGTPVSHLSPIR